MELFRKSDIKYFDIGDLKGVTDYIDFLRWDEITEPVMRGIDIFRRHFVVVKFKIYDSKSKKKNKFVKLMQTYFQRYTDGSLWMGCGNATDSFLDTCGGMKKEQIDLVKQVINNKSVVILEEHTPTCSDFVGKIVELYDEEKEKAAETIQKYWLLCRYNPKYQVCKKLQMEGYLDIFKSYE